MISCRCTKIIKDKHNKIIALDITDGENFRTVTADNLKNLIRGNQLYVDNILLTRDNRLLDKATMSHKDEVRANRIPVVIADDTKYAGKEQLAKGLNQAFPHTNILQLEEGTKFRFNRHMSRFILCRFKDLKIDIRSLISKGKLLGVAKEIQPGLYVIKHNDDTIVTANCNEIHLPESCSQMFEGLDATKVIIGGVTFGPYTYDYTELFYACTAKEIRLSPKFFADESGIILNKAFDSCGNLEYLDLGTNFRLGCSADYYRIFHDCHFIKTIKAQYNAFMVDNTYEFAKETGLIDDYYDDDDNFDGSEFNMKTLLEKYVYDNFAPDITINSCVIVTPQGKQTLKQQIEALVTALYDSFYKFDE